MNKKVLKTIGKDSYEVHIAYVNTLPINGIDEWFKVKVLTELRMFDSYGSDSSKLYFIDYITDEKKLETLKEINRILLQGKPKDYHSDYNAVAKDYSKLILRVEPNLKSKKLHFVINKQYFKWVKPQTDMMFANYMSGVKQDWGVNTIKIGKDTY